MPRILVIEDDSAMRTMMEETLTSAGHEIFLAEDGEQGLKFCRAEPMELIITDIYMPGMEGLEFIRTLRRERVGVPVIAVSGNPDLQSALSIASKLGAVKTLAKPFRAEELRAAVGMALRAWAGRR